MITSHVLRILTSYSQHQDSPDNTGYSHMGTFFKDSILSLSAFLWRFQKCIFDQENFHIFVQIWSNNVLQVQFIISDRWLRWWLVVKQATSTYLNHLWLNLLTHIYVLMVDNFHSALFGFWKWLFFTIIVQTKKKCDCQWTKPRCYHKSLMTFIAKRWCIKYWSSCIRLVVTTRLTECNLGTPHGVIYLGQHWLK